jgi:hypothetical protein
MNILGIMTQLAQVIVTAPLVAATISIMVTSKCWRGRYYG